MANEDENGTSTFGVSFQAEGYIFPTEHLYRSRFSVVATFYFFLFHLFFGIFPKKYRVLFNRITSVYVCFVIRIGLFILGPHSVWTLRKQLAPQSNCKYCVMCISPKDELSIVMFQVLLLCNECLETVSSFWKDCLSRPKRRSNIFTNLNDGKEGKNESKRENQTERTTSNQQQKWKYSTKFFSWLIWLWNLRKEIVAH